MLSVEMRYENIPMIGGLVTNYESVETMQIGGYANYTTFIYKIAEDVYKKKYLANPVISSKDAGYSWKVFENIKDLYSKDSISPDYYKLTYKTPLYWIKEINILIDKNKDLFKNLLINKEREMKTAVCSCFKREVKI